MYNESIDIYLNKLDNNTNKYFTDTTFICNKLGEELEVKKPKTSKNSIISDDFDIPISIKIESGSVHDSTVLEEQLITLNKKHPKIFNSTTILVADAAYDSNKLRELVAKLNFNKIVTGKNIRNTKNKEKIEASQNTFYEHMLLKKRICIEHLIGNLKSFKKIQLRYERHIKTFKSFVYLANLIIN